MKKEVQECSLCPEEMKERKIRTNLLSGYVPRTEGENCSDVLYFKFMKDNYVRPTLHHKD